MNVALCDASVVVKWFHRDGEPEADAARRILDRHRSGDLVLEVLDLTFYELGNVLVGSLRWPADKVIVYLTNLAALCGSGVALSPATWMDAAVLASGHGLTFYDACYWAAARSLEAPLITSDHELLAAGAGLSPTEFAATL